MKEINISKIVVKDNIRVEYGDLSDLIASIKQFGVRRPIEIDKNGELIDGHRRLKAAKKAGLIGIPYFVNETEIEKRTEQMITALHTKSLDPVEEGRAFSNFLRTNEAKIKTAADLAKIISKPVEFVEKRLLIVNLPEEARKALVNKKISVGHALLLAKFPEADGLKLLKEIRRENWSVEATKAQMEYHSLGGTNLSEITFDKKDCKGCRFNGSEQTELFEIGSSLKGKCMNKGCFIKKLGEFVIVKGKQLKKVIFKSESDYETPNGFVEKGTYAADEAKVTPAFMKKCREEMNPENYLVKITAVGKIKEFFKPKASKKEREKTEVKSTIDRSRKLSEKVDEFKTNLMVKESAKLVKPGSNQLKAMVMYHFINDMGFITEEDDEKLGTLFGADAGINDIDKMLKADSKTLDKALALTSEGLFNEIAVNCDEDLEMAAKSVGFVMEKHFVMTEGFLQLFTKEQMIKLAKELKIGLGDSEKNPEIRAAIIKGWQKGQVPKVMSK
ncbi:MAG: ParB/RepB/Spo0J family partition protein [Candidatus Woesearchaeota archaeon]